MTAAARDHPAYDLAACRARVPILASAIPMNNCSQAPQTDATRAAALRYLDEWNTRGMDWDGWMDEVALAKAEFARLINASAEHIAVCCSVSAATSAIATALDFSGERTTVVASEAEFPTVGQVWLAQERRGARVRWAPLRNGAVDVAAYEELIDERTRAVSACHGYYLDGALQDLGALARLAHAKGALLYVDAYQTLGTVPVDVAAAGVDFLASGNLKFLMGIPGIAFLYIRGELIERLEPLVTGWFGRTTPFGFDLKTLDWAPGASRFDGGTPPVVNAYVARAGMGLINRLGTPAIRSWLQLLGQRLLDGGAQRGLTIFGPSDMTRKTATTAFAVDDSHAVERALRERRVIASARGPVIRLAPHYYTTLDDVDAALDALADVLRPA